MTKIHKTDFVGRMDGKSIDVREAQRNPQLAEVNVGRADLNHDGKIKGTDEAAQLFKEVDRFDSDGSAHSIAALTPAGTPTKGARLLDVLSGHIKADGPTNVGGSSGANGESVVRAARMLVTERGQNYGVDDPWFNLDPNHALPANVSLGGLKGRWKCNLFACNTVYAAGFEPPYYNNRGRGEYPNANQLFKWSDKYAGQYGNKTHFKLMGELDPQSLEGEAREKAIRDLLRSAQPGDLIIVDHMGTDVADGGHCRVLLGGDLGDGSGTLQCAQASFDAAAIKDETVHSFTGEERIWILRPNRPRAANGGQPIA
ncbi:MAG: hypothetical protein AB2A00_23415 [Myxococcota bacterium]